LHKKQDENLMRPYAVGMEANMQTLGQALRSARSARGLTQAEAAAEMQVLQSTVSRWEKDEQEPKRREDYEALAQFLSIPLTEVGALVGATAMRRVMREIRGWED
jgi:transcriptional regulator with XRE-family HTH domain